MDLEISISKNDTLNTFLTQPIETFTKAQLLQLKEHFLHERGLLNEALETIDIAANAEIEQAPRNLTLHIGGRTYKSRPSSFGGIPILGTEELARRRLLDKAVTPICETPEYMLDPRLDLDTRLIEINEHLNTLVIVLCNQKIEWMSLTARAVLGNLIGRERAAHIALRSRKHLKERRAFLAEGRISPTRPMTYLTADGLPIRTMSFAQPTRFNGQIAVSVTMRLRKDELSIASESAGVEAGART